MKFRLPATSIIILLLTFIAGIYFYKSCVTPKENVPQIDSTLMINRIEKVMKMVSVEGHYTEMLRYDNSTFDFPGFRKKALVQVTGRVMVGYNMENFEMNYDVKKKTLDIKNFPKPEILSIETNSKYFDMEQGIFNSFTKDELSLIDKKSKEVIRNKALSDQLIPAAEEQKNEMLMLLLDPLLQSGWEVSINGQNFNSSEIQINKK